MAVLKIVSFVLVFLFCVAFKPLHHGWANYDQDKTLDYKGIIQESVYENPHATAKVKHNNKTWLVILAPVSRLEARGVTARMLKKGAAIQVVGYPHKEVKGECVQNGSLLMVRNMNCVNLVAALGTAL